MKIPTSVNSTVIFNLDLNSGFFLQDEKEPNSYLTKPHVSLTMGIKF